MVGSETPSTSGAQLGELCCSVSFANSGFSAGLQEELEHFQKEFMPK